MAGEYEAKLTQVRYAILTPQISYGRGGFDVAGCGLRGRQPATTGQKMSCTQTAPLCVLP